MTDKSIGDLFANYYSTPTEEDRPHQETPETPIPADRVNDHPFLEMTVDQWMDDQSAPITVELDSPRGKLYLTKSRKEHKRLVAACAVVFTPLEIERFIELQKKCKLARADRLERGEEEGKPAINEALIDLIYATKKMDPGAKLDEMKLIIPELDQDWPKEEME